MFYTESTIYNQLCVHLTQVEQQGINECLRNLQDVLH